MGIFMEIGSMKMVKTHHVSVFHHVYGGTGDHVAMSLLVPLFPTQLTSNISTVLCTIQRTAYLVGCILPPTFIIRRTSQQRGIRPRVVVAGNFNVKIGSCRTRSSLAAPNSTDLKIPRFDDMIIVSTIWL